jgi:hypothetical protein
LLFCLLTIVTAVIPMLLLPTTALPVWPQQIVAVLAMISLSAAGCRWPSRRSCR